MRAPTRLYVNQPSMQTWVKEVFLFPTDPSLTSPLCCVLRRLAFMDHINPLASFQSVLLDSLPKGGTATHAQAQSSQ